MITQLKTNWNLDIYLKALFILYLINLFSSVYPLFSSTKSGPLPELECSHSSKGMVPMEVAITGPSVQQQPNQNVHLSCQAITTVVCPKRGTVAHNFMQIGPYWFPGQWASCRELPFFLIIFFSFHNHKSFFGESMANGQWPMAIITKSTLWSSQMN